MPSNTVSTSILVEQKIYSSQPQTKQARAKESKISKLSPQLPQKRIKPKVRLMSERSELPSKIRLISVIELSKCNR